MSEFTIMDVPVQYRTLNVGIYDGTDYCPNPECENHDFVKGSPSPTIAFASAPIPDNGNFVAGVVVCEKCGIRFWYHALIEDLENFLKQKHVQ